jgi:hypothetical protein
LRQRRTAQFIADPGENEKWAKPFGFAHCSQPGKLRDFATA